MRGVVSAGMVSALEHSGPDRTRSTPCTDRRPAPSTARISWPARRRSAPTSTPKTSTTDTSSISRGRSAGRPIVDLGFLIDDVARRRKPLDVDRVLAVAVAADRDGDRRRAARARRRSALSRRRVACFAALRAGATMPVVAGPPVDYGGRSLPGRVAHRADPGAAGRSRRIHARRSCLLTRPAACGARRRRARSLLRHSPAAAALAGPGGAVRRPRRRRTPRLLDADCQGPWTGRSAREVLGSAPDPARGQQARKAMPCVCAAARRAGRAVMQVRRSAPSVSDTRAR